MPPLHAFGSFLMSDVLRVGVHGKKSKRPAVMAGLPFFDSECVVFYGAGTVIVAASSETAAD